MALIGLDSKMPNFSIPDVLAVIGNKELIIMGLNRDIESLQAKIKSLENKIKELTPELKKEKDNG